MQLYEDQVPFVEHILNSEQQIECICAPTGAGKTIIFSEVTKQFEKDGKKVIIIVNRIELMQQTKKHLFQIGVIPAILKNGVKKMPIGTPLIAMVETLDRRLKKWSFAHFDVAIIDECHRGEYIKLIHHFPRVIGFTATPVYIKKGKSLETYYKSLYAPSQLSEYIEKGRITKPITYVPKNMVEKFSTKMGDYDEKEQGEILVQKKYIDTVVNYWKERQNKNALVFNTTIEHSIAVESALKEAGANVVHVDGSTNKEERLKVRDRLKNERGLWVCNVGIFTFGFDSAYIDVIMLNRKTKSIALYNQIAGRGGRVLPGKEHFEILDMHGSCIECGTWDEDKNWSYLFQKKKSDKIGVKPVKFCPGCDAVILKTATVCEFCGFMFEKIKSDILVIDQDPGLTEYQRKIKSGMRILIDTAKERGWNKFKPLRDMVFKEINLSRGEARNPDFSYIVEQFIEANGYKPGFKRWIFETYIPKLIGEDQKVIETLIQQADSTDSDYF